MSTSAVQLLMLSTEACLKPSLRYSLLSWFGYSGQASQRTIGPSQQLEVATHDLVQLSKFGQVLLNFLLFCKTYWEFLFTLCELILVQRFSDFALLLAVLSTKLQGGFGKMPGIDLVCLGFDI